MTISGKDIINSVIFQILMAMLLIGAMALASMSLAVYVTLSVQDDAEAINLAGSLRMQSYRIAHLLSQASKSKLTDPVEAIANEREQFTVKLFQSSISESVLSSRNIPLKKSYQQVVSNWQNGVQPVLSLTQASTVDWQDVAKQYNKQVREYVDDIDYMVTHFQRNTEGKIELLGMIEGVSIILTLFTVIYLVMKVDSNFVSPLRGLVRAAEQVEQGDLGHRTNYSGENELGLLSQTFDNMTASLEAQYRTLEEQVAERTEELHKSNQALYFLYKTSREISSSPYDPKLLGIFLQDLKRVADVESINLCVNAEPNYVDYQLISTDQANQPDCFGDCEDCGLSPEQMRDSDKPGLSLPIKSRDDTYGFLNIQSKQGVGLEPWQNQLLNTVAETLSTAFAFHHTLGQERRVILMEERSIIARELHDSIAQSLSYMKLETARLKKMIERGFEQDKVEGAISGLQEGLNAAYKHLRELLVTFRVKLDAPDLHTALKHAVQAFGEQTSASVSLDYTLAGHALGPNDDIHVLHILREALNNAVQHAQAQHIVLRCYRGGSGEVVFLVEDDGIGLPSEPEREHHYGLYTMRERARQLKGELSCGRRSSGGTRIELRVNRVMDMLQV